MTNARVFHNNEIHNNEIHNNERTPSGTMAKDECSFQDLVLVVEAHRKRY